jgi:phage tail-like protein
MSPLLDTHDAVMSFLYHIEIDGLQIANFKEVSGLSVERPLIEQKVTSGNGSTETRKYPGSEKFGDITLKRGVTENDELYKWIEQVTKHDWDEAHRNGSIVQFHQGMEVNRWNFVDGWPSKWELAGQKSDASEVLVETLTIKVGEITKG